MSKTIVTHIGPDQDAITSSWLIKRYLPGWEEADHMFVNAGGTLNDQKVDSDPYIIHVDTGLGRFDHHQLDDPEKKHSGTERVFTYLLEAKHIPHYDEEALSRIVAFVTKIDHFGEANFPDPTSDVYDFELYQILDALRLSHKTDREICELGFACLDGLLILFKNKVKAEKEIQYGFKFESKWGQGLALESKNEETLKFALKSGLQIALRKDPDRGHVRIKAHPNSDIDLSPVYEEILKQDKKGTWFLHKSKKLVLNGSSHAPDSTPTELPLKKVIEIIRGIA